MALTKAKIREILSKAGVDESNIAEAVDEIIGGHVASIDALREERDSYKEKAEKLDDVQKELDKVKGFEQKYNDLKKEHDDYVEAQGKKEIAAKKQTAYKAMLKDIGVSEKRLDTIMRVTDLSKIEFDEDGKTIKGIDALKESAKNEWADFITTKREEGARTPDPHRDGNGNGGDEGRTGRAAELAKKYHDNLYGKVKE